MNQSPYNAPKPNNLFVLQPSSRSAFHPLHKMSAGSADNQRSSSSTTSLNFFPGPESFAQLYAVAQGDGDHRASSVPPQWPSSTVQYGTYPSASQLDKP